MKGLDWNTILLAIIALFGAAFTSAMSYLMAKVNKNSKIAAENAVKTVETAMIATSTVEKIHLSVNSEREKLLQKLDMLREEILSVSKAKAVSDEKLRAQIAGMQPDN